MKKEKKLPDPVPPTGHYRNYLAKEYLNSEELEPERQYPFTISHCMEEWVHNPGSHKEEKVLTAWLVEMIERNRRDPSKLNKRIIIGNKWNMQVLEKMTGSPLPENWNNLPIFVYRGNENCRDRTQFGVRIKARKVAEPKPGEEGGDQ